MSIEATTRVFANSKSKGPERHAGLARDLARAAFLIRRRAWRHLKVEFCGHPFVPLAALSGAIADANLAVPADLLSVQRVLIEAEGEHCEAVANMLFALGAEHG